MSANVETMMYVREKPWHGLGTMVQEAVNSADALRLAGLDWTVEQNPIQLWQPELGEAIKNYKANVRTSDGKVLGVVSDKYKIVQNSEAFSFTDALIGGDVRYNTAGSLNGGRKIWMLAQMPETEILGDKVEPFLCFSNTHDGSGSIRVCMTPIRVVCQNTLNLALSGARRQWSTRHMGNLSQKMGEAQHSLEMANTYMGELAGYAERMANTKLYRDKLDSILDELFPSDDEDSKQKKINNKRVRDEFYVCYFADDIKKFQNTAYGAINAMSDMVTHNAPLRKTENYRENNWGRVMDGHAVLDRMVEMVGVK